ncbi:MAG: hypothetical protein HC945_00365 [Nitrosarchaeum sp.]|nr:hypothetical protein [Nitrosarchaeum sp.]
MELPIRIIVVLFVTLLVASSLLIFARDIIEDARGNIDQISIDKDKEPEQDKILTLATLTTDQLEALIRECYKQGRAELESYECFIVRSQNPPMLTRPPLQP